MAIERLRVVPSVSEKPDHSHRICADVYHQLYLFHSFTRSLLGLELVSALSSLVIMALSFGLQGLGHSKEVNPAVPFTGFKNAVVRILLEQFYTFLRFVLTGKWYRAWRDSDS
ncbi:hypothetical protein HJA72_000668 [Vibrio fluvialis]|nr:hypothetical protein [Vibrio fluvialis]